MLDGGDDLRPRDPIRIAQVRSRLGFDGAVGQDVEDAFELGCALLLEQPPGGLGRALDAVACLFVHPLRRYWMKIFLPAPISSRHSSRSPARAWSSCSSLSIPPAK